MTNTNGPSLAFTQLCNYLAVRSTATDQDETARNLVIQAMAVLPTEPIQGPTQLQEAIEVLFGVKMSEARLQTAIDYLSANQSVLRQPSGNLVLARDLAGQVQKRIDDANELQERVKQKWLTDCQERHPGLDLDLAWAALQEYLARLFRQHGMQTVSLLDSSLQLPTGQEGLRTILTAVVTEKCSPDRAQAVQECMTDFLVDVGCDEDRFKFVVQLADGAFMHFALNAPPEVSTALRQNLSQLTLFLDTNFLFGVMDLHSHPLVEASQELVQAINENHLPFLLTYHPETEQEMRRTIEAIVLNFKGRVWPQPMSRAAVRSRNITGLELQFHRKNSTIPVDPDVFFAPYQHIDVLLTDKNILRYDRDDIHNQGTNEWHTAYQQYIQIHRPEKPQASILHDTTLLDCVHRKITVTKSSLEAGALCITCDYLLYRFDWEESFRRGMQPVMVLPNLFLQILRAFIPPSWDFDKVFAETFAIPEFRTIGSGSSQAASRLLALLSTYKDFPEETAVRMLANDALIDELRRVQDPVRFEEQVEAAVVSENAELLEDKTELERQLARQQAESEEQGRRWLAERQEMAAQLQEEEQRAVAVEQTQFQLQAKLGKVERDAASATVKANQLENSLIRLVMGIRVAGLLAAAAIWLAAVLLIPDRLGWQWLLVHPNRYAMQAVAVVLGVLAFGGALFPRWRNRLWFGSAGVLALLIVLLSLLGGPRG